jgi:hypothetical protein
MCFAVDRTAAALICAGLALLGAACRTDAVVVSRLAYERSGLGSSQLAAQAEQARQRATKAAAEAEAMLPQDHRQPVTAGGAPAILDDRLDLLEQKSESLPLEGRMLADSARADFALAQELSSAASTLSEADARGADIYKPGLYYSVQPLVAFDSDLDATTIAALGVNWRFLGAGQPPLAGQLLLGGALNPNAAGRESGAAIGLGLAYPVGTNGTISIGHVWWNEDGDGQNGVFVSLTLGDFGKSARER